MNTETVESLEMQLRSLYEEREFLAQKYGVSSADEVVSMVSNLEAQLHDFYHKYGSFDSDDNSGIILGRLKELSSALDPMYSQKSVTFTFENNRPVLRAEWTEQLNQGDAQ